MTEDTYIGIEEVTERFNITRTTARNWCTQGLLSHIVVNNKIMVSRQSVELMTAHAISLKKAESNIKDVMTRHAEMKLLLEGEMNVMKNELENRHWTNNHIQYFSEMFALMMDTLQDGDDYEDNAKLVKYFLDGNDYKDISVLTDIPLCQVMASVRKFGRNMLRTRSYIALNNEVHRLKEELAEKQAVLDENRRMNLKIEMLTNEINALQHQLDEKEVGGDASKEEGAGKAVKTVGKDNILNDVYFREVSEFEFSARLSNVLATNNIRTIGQIVELGRENFSKLRNVGARTMYELDDFLKKHHLNIR